MGFGLLVLTKKKAVNETKTAFRNLDQSIIEDFLARIKDVNLKILKLILTEQDSLSNSFDSYTVYTELVTSEFFINNDEGMKQYKTFSKKNKLTYIDLSALEKKNIAFTQTNFNYPDQVSSSYAILNTLDESLNEIKLDASVTRSGVGLIDFDNYTYYIDRKIDIYNPDDPAFAQFCYFTDEFEFDLTQDYRKQIFQNKTPILQNFEKKCKYSDINVETEEINFKCTSIIANDFTAIVTFKDVPETGLWEYKDIALICPAYVQHIERNIAFWVFLFFNVFVIVYDIVISIISHQNVISDSFFSALENDGFEVGDRKQLSGEKIEQQLIPGNEIVPVGLEVNQRPLDYIFCHNIFALHPLFSLGYNSIIQPPIMTSWFFLLSMVNYFGFNAVYFSPAMLEDRIYDRHRDNFDFPMRTEFEKIMSAICTNMLITFFVRLICMVAVWERNDLGESIIRAKNQRAKFLSIGDFNNRTMCKRALAGVFILLLDVFFWFYTITFCGMYVKAQYGWLYSGVWTLLWIWAVFAPIYIFIISLVEYNGNPNCTYYMKRLFIF